MPTESANSSSMWLMFTLLTVFSWGIYGVMLHTGQLGMSDPANGRIKAFLFVGIAYFLTAVLAPLAILVMNGSSWDFPMKGLWWSLGAGIVGAVGALCVLLAFGAKGSPTTVMTIVFAGAPIVNAVAAIAMHPPEKGWEAIDWRFLLGILLAVVGGTLVSFYKPGPPQPAKPVAAPAAPAAPVAPAADPGRK